MSFLQKHSVLLASLVGLAGVLLFPWGGFFLLPVAMDLWELRQGATSGAATENEVAAQG